MTVPALTPRGFWMRVFVFGASLIVYLWAARIVLPEYGYIGIVPFFLLILLSLAGLIATVARRPSRYRR
jgi:hypothetical protein